MTGIWAEQADVYTSPPSLKKRKRNAVQEETAASLSDP